MFQRIGQEYASNIHAVDVVNSSDAAHFIVWKRDSVLAPYVSEDVAKYYPAEHRDPDGQFASFRVWLSIIAYNTNLVKAEDAPKSFADLVDPKWKGKIVKAHPGYSGTIMTATYQMQRDLGWSFFEQLAKQNIMQVQSSADPPKKLDLGERAVMADGNEYNIFQMKEAGRPVDPVYASEGSPLIIGPNGVFKDAPHPKAARLFQSFSLSREAQQLIIDVGGLRSVHSQTSEKAGRKPLKDIKTMKDDAAAVEKESDFDQGALHQDLPRLTAMAPQLPTTSVAETLAGKIVALKPAALPSATARKCEDLLIDVVGLCVTARNEDYIRSALAGCDDDGPCTAIGHKRMLTAAGAAFVNGTAAHGEDFDDTLRAARFMPER